MKRILSYAVKTVLIIFIALTFFYFWGSKATLSPEEYTSVFQTEKISNNEQDSVFSIITYNIGYLSGMTNNTAQDRPKTLFDTNLKKVKKAFKNLDADFIAFQEIDYNAKRSYEVNQEEEIASLGYSFRARSVNWDKTYVPFPYWPPSAHFGKVVSGQSILSKYPIQNQERIVLDRVASTPFYKNAFYIDRLLQIVTVVIGGKELKIMNVHLEAFDQTTREIQFKRVVKKFEELSQDYATILLGDFNSDPRFKNAVISSLLTLENVGNAGFNSEEITNSFSSKNPYKRLDYIFYNKNFITCLEGSVLSEFGETSDHLPVYMTFKIN